MIGVDEGKYFQIRAQLRPEEKMELVDFLKSNADFFAWRAYDALRIEPKFICHQLNVNLETILRRQSPRRSSKEHLYLLQQKKCGPLQQKNLFCMLRQ